MKDWQKGIIVAIEKETSQTKKFFIQVPEIEKFDFIPGQFVTLDLPIHEQKNKRWRSYSIASAPNGTNIFELIIVYLEGGAGTNYLFNEAGIGTEFLLRGPLGKFILPEKIEKNIFLICTGTGIAPFRSMVRYIHEHKIPHHQIHLIFGCRKFTDGLYLNELRELTKVEPNFHFHVCFSREHEVHEPGHYTGYVHQVYEQLLQTNKTAASFYLCGWKNMIDEAKERILALGYDRKDIHLELYG
ncbi:ferredoxin--NADP reductase [Hydrotalea sandarakina]|jgi:CDP-4-dehydro-6-deoxyglucose reductase|uniref:CDP-4-dehydro-6-deoxyglucose reductase n=1 Tax=Hydrotalea sandarakina TaxID=1004304 RepID=A0A2W7RVT6_9BACT|nr:FAD-binding oxidoreductase [Hydrotalea sandarakina]PZX64581.1 CDP-4-dehydro-6-deoxyglucose reductase [Hydrotalea sandarakina]